MPNENTPAAEATATPPAEKENVAAAAPAAEAKVETQTETPAAEVTNKAEAEKAKVDDAAVEPKPEDKPVVPEKYELKLSENSPLSASEVAKVETLAREKGLSNEQAQEVLNERQDLKTSFVQQQQEAQSEAIHQMHRGWAAELANDRDFGGENLKQTAEHAKRFLDKFGDDTLRKALNDKVLRWGDNPTLLRAFARAGRVMAEDKLVTEGKTGSLKEKKSTAEVLYGDTTKS